MRVQDMCEWTQDYSSKWHPSCRCDVATRLHPPLVRGYDFCPFCGREAIVGGAMITSGLCPVCCVRDADRVSGFCIECEANGAAGAHAAKTARATLRQRRSRDARRAAAC